MTHHLALVACPAALDGAAVSMVGVGTAALSSVTCSKCLELALVGWMSRWVAALAGCRGISFVTK